LRIELLKALSYFDVFEHPLNLKELQNLSSETKGNSTSVEASLEQLVQEQLCYRQGEYYSLREDISTLLEKRKQKEVQAASYFKKLPAYASIIRYFPFVRGIAISGSLSKGVMHQKGDIDYFIITHPGRLWICRSLLILFKKIFLLNSRKYFCVNYFVDEDNLKIIDKNIFTAVEVSFLAPVYNAPLFDRLKKENTWTQAYFPHFEHPIKLSLKGGNPWLKSVLEKLFIGRAADRLDLFLMKLTYKRWRKKFGHFNEEKLELTMRSNRGVSKHHPKDFQNKVLEQYQQRLKRLELKE
jgi:hypothetical protein